MNGSTQRPFNLLQKNIKLILDVAFVFAAVAFVYALKKKTLYIATTSFSLEDAKSSGGSSLLGLASQFGFDLGGDVGGVFSGDNIIELFKTRRIVEAALLKKDNNNKLLVEELYENILLNNRKSASDREIANFSFALTQKSRRLQYLQDSIMGELCKYVISNLIQVEKPDKKLNIIMISCKTPSEIFSKNLCDFLVEEVSNFYIETKVGRARKNVEILQSKADSLRRVYSNKLSGRASISDANVNPLFQTSQIGVVEKQTDISVVLTAYTEVVKNLEISKFSLLRETPLIQIIDYPKYPLQKKKPNLVGYAFAGFFSGLLLTISVLIFLFLIRVYFKNG